MRIAIVHSDMTRVVDGSLRIVYELSKELNLREHEVRVFANDISSENLEKMECDIYYNNIVDKKLSSTNLDQIKNTLEPIAGFNSIKISKPIKEFDPDVTLVTFYDGISLAKYVRCPCCYFCFEPHRILYEEGVFTQFSKLAGTKGLLFKVLRPLLRYYDRKAIARFDCVITNSYHVREVAWWLYGIHCKVAPQGVSVEKFRSLENIEKEDNTALYVGRFSFTKRTDMLLESLEYCDAKLLLVGSPSSAGYTNKIEKLIDKYSSRIKIMKNVSEQKLIELYNHASVFVYPALMEPGITMAILEAMACGTPVIATNEGGSREIVVDGETGYLVETSPVLLAQAIKKVTNNKHLAKRMGENARKRVTKNYTWKAFADKVEGILKETHEKHKKTCL